MGRLVDILSVALFLAAAASFVQGIRELGNEQDFQAVYWTALGAVLLKGAVDILRPLRGS